MIRPSEKGFSMIEVTISVFLIGIVFVGAMLSYGTSMKTSFANKAKNNAIRLAQQTIEDLKQYDQQKYDKNSDIWNKNSPKYVLTDQNVRIDNVLYTVKKMLIDTNNLNLNINSDNYIPIRVTVQWAYQGSYQIVVDTSLIKWQ